jgi:formate hydrogenlyase subunit 3/multisubunit Na+/H+ antiporter MnhD subunit
MAILYLKKADLLLSLFIIVTSACGITGIVTFILYGRARMKEDERREQLYLRIHYIALTMVFILAMIFMFYMVNTSD